MGRRSYGQHCPLAYALDVLGERWTLLVTRELMFGEKRYTDLLDGLPGIGPQVLAARLKHLQANGLVQKRKLPPPAASTVYELTELGRELEDTLVGLARFGLNFVEPNGEPGTRRLAGFVAATVPTEPREAARGVKETYEFRIDEDTFHVRVNDGDVSIREGPVADPDLVVESDLMTLSAIGKGELKADDAVARGKASVEGDPAVVQRCAEILVPTAGVHRA
jgi:DNA-binding HxlR family transcriptional regulator/putative sterol carrier protein